MPPEVRSRDRDDTRSVASRPAAPPDSGQVRDGDGASHDDEDPGALRHPADILRVVLGAAGCLLAALVSRQGRPPFVERDLFRLVNDLPPHLEPPMVVATQGGALPAVGVAAVLALVFRRRRMALDLIVAGLAVWGVAWVIRELVDRGRPAVVLSHVVLRGDAIEQGLGFPSAHAAVAAAMATAAGPYLGRSARRVTWIAVALVALARVYVGAHLPADVLGGVALGWAVAAAVQLALGSPGGRASASEVETTLDQLGLGPATVRRARVDARGSAPFFATVGDGRRLFVKALGKEQRDADLLFRGWRRLTLRTVEDEAPFATAKREVEHEAYLSLLAQRAGVHTPALIAAGQTETGTAILATEQVDGQGMDVLPADHLTDEIVDRLWAEVSKLRAVHIAHRDLRPANVLLDGDARPWLIDFGFSEASASPRRLAQDVAELIASLAISIGPKRAVGGAARALGRDAVAAAVPLLQPLALSSYTRGEMRKQHGLLGRVHQEAADVSGVENAELEPLARIRPRTIVMMLMALVGIHLLLPQTAELRRTVDALHTAEYPWLAVALLFSIATYLAAGLSILGAVRSTLSYTRTVGVQAAASFTNRVTPGSLGGIGVNLRYLGRCGLSRSEAVEAVALNSVAGGIVHVTALVVTAVLLGQSSIGDVHLPHGWPVLVAVVALLAVAGIVLWSPLGRRRIGGPAVRSVHSVIALTRRPTKAAQLFGGSIAITTCYIITLGASLAAFHAGVSPIKVAAVYLGASAIASAAPTPGGLGAVEAALVAGLTAVGTSTGPAVAGVLAFRLVTFWLPIVPGWLTFRALGKRQVI